MSKTKKEKLTPPILASREGMEAAIADYAKLKLKHLSLTAELEAETIALGKKYQDRLTDLGQQIELKFAAVQNYCVLHRAELLPGDLKSFETLSAVVSFYYTPHRVEKRGKETLGALAKRLLGLVFKITGPDGQPDELSCAQYVREGDPELDKQALLAHRKKLTPDQLQAMGIKFEQDEIFSIEPKSQLTQGDKTANPEPIQQAA